MFCGQEEMISIRTFLLGEIGRLCIRDTRPNGYRERNLRAIMLCGRSHISGYHLGSASLTATDESHDPQQTSRTWSTHCGMQEKQLRPGAGALEPSGFKICTSAFLKWAASRYNVPRSTVEIHIYARGTVFSAPLGRPWTATDDAIYLDIHQCPCL